MAVSILNTISYNLDHFSLHLLTVRLCTIVTNKTKHGFLECIAFISTWCTQIHLLYISSHEAVCTYIRSCYICILCSYVQCNYYTHANWKHSPLQTLPKTFRGILATSNTTQGPTVGVGFLLTVSPTPFASVCRHVLQYSCSIYTKIGQCHAFHACML